MHVFQSRIPAPGRHGKAQRRAIIKASLRDRTSFVRRLAMRPACRASTAATVCAPFDPEPRPEPDRPWRRPRLLSRGRHHSELGDCRLLWGSLPARSSRAFAQCRHSVASCLVRSIYESSRSENCPVRATPRARMLAVCGGPPGNDHEHQLKSSSLRDSSPPAGDSASSSRYLRRRS